GQTTNPATSLAAGNYSVTITTNNGCSAVASITLNEPSALSAGTITSTDHNGYNISCNGGANGDATANPSGGTGGNTFLWSNGQTTNPATSLSAGNYSVTVTNNNGCTAIASITLNQPTALSASTTATQVCSFASD